MQRHKCLWQGVNCLCTIGDAGKVAGTRHVLAGSETNLWQSLATGPYSTGERSTGDSRPAEAIATRPSNRQGSAPAEEPPKGQRESGESQSSGNRRAIKSIAHLRPAAARAIEIGENAQSRPAAARDAQGTKSSQINAMDRRKRLETSRMLANMKRRQPTQSSHDENRHRTSDVASKEGRVAQGRTARAATEPDPREALLAQKSLKEWLTPADCLKYVQIEEGLLPELFLKERPKRERIHPKMDFGLQEELEVTGSNLVMHRECTQDLMTLARAKERKQIYLTGPPSSGRSIALAAVVSALRAEDWLVMYLPQAKIFTHGGFFYANSKGSWDTPESAKLAMHFLLLGNKGRVEDTKSARSSKSLKQLLEEGQAANEYEKVVDIFLEVLETIASADNSLVAIDNYQTLYLPSEYGEWLNNFSRRVIQPQELRVAKALQLLDQPAPRDGLVIGAAGAASLPRSLHVPLPPQAVVNIPRMSKAEWDVMAQFYQIEAGRELSPGSAEKAFFCTNGNAKEFRKYLELFNMYDLTDKLKAVAA